ncbi:uncharacterized protein [Mytilus edulis]|uniref:uncharacterized protein n=1 Tax=Mytilus edulis TaxID=6550 RepID=UPI0039EFDEFD
MTNVNMKDSAKYKDLIQGIEAQNVKVKNAADKYTDHLKSELNKKWRALQTEEIEKLEKVIVSLQGLLNSNVEDIVLSNDVEKSFIESSKLSCALNIAETNLGSISFLSGQISPNIMGSLQVVSNAVDKVKPVGHELTVQSTFNIEVYGLAVTPTGDLLLVPDGSVLKQISGKTGELTDSIYNMSPLDPISIHVTKDGKVIVAAKSGGSAWPATGRRVIFVMNKKGERETIYEHDKNNIRLFIYPLSITSTDNGNICLVDQLSKEYRGRVVVLNRDGDILQIYSGHDEINNEDNPFHPVNIVTTPSDNIIVAQLNNNIFHILNNCGHFIMHYNVGDAGISSAYSLCFTRNEEQLYIGCSTEVGSSEKAKLYEVHISGC